MIRQNQLDDVINAILEDQPLINHVTRLLKQRLSPAARCDKAWCKQVILLTVEQTIEELNLVDVIKNNIRRIQSAAIIIENSSRLESNGGRTSPLIPTPIYSSTEPVQVASIPGRRYKAPTQKRNTEAVTTEDATEISDEDEYPIVDQRKALSMPEVKSLYSKGSSHAKAKRAEQAAIAMHAIQGISITSTEGSYLNGLSPRKSDSSSPKNQFSNTIAESLIVSIPSVVISGTNSNPSSPTSRNGITIRGRQMDHFDSVNIRESIPDVQGEDDVLKSMQEFDEVLLRGQLQSPSSREIVDSYLSTVSSQDELFIREEMERATGKEDIVDQNSSAYSDAVDSNEDTSAMAGHGTTVLLQDNNNNYNNNYNYNDNDNYKPMDSADSNCQIFDFSSRSLKEVRMSEAIEVEGNEDEGYSEFNGMTVNDDFISQESLDQWERRVSKSLQRNSSDNSDNEIAVSQGDQEEEEEEDENNEAGNTSQYDNDFEEDVPEEDESSHIRHVRFTSPLISSIETREKYSRDEVTLLFYTHEESQKFNWDFESEYNRATAAGLSWNDWIDIRTDEDIQREEEEAASKYCYDDFETFNEDDAPDDDDLYQF